MQQQLFDIDHLNRQRQRYANTIADYDFLYHRVAEDIELRLHGITRHFPLAYNLNAGHGVITEILNHAPNIDKIIEADCIFPADIAADKTHTPRADFQLCKGEALPFAGQSADLIVSALNLQTINDLPGYLRQICLTLKPDGLFLGALVGGRSLHELRTVLMQAEEEITGGITPRVIPFADIKDIGALMQRAGFALPVTDLDGFSVQYDSLFHLMKDLRGMGAANILTQRKKTPTAKSLFMRAAQLYQEQFITDGRINATCEIIHLTGWAPSPDQPKALKPGSGTTSLASAVNKLRKE